MFLKIKDKKNSFAFQTLQLTLHNNKVVEVTGNEPEVKTALRDGVVTEATQAEYDAYKEKNEKQIQASDKRKKDKQDVIDAIVAKQQGLKDKEDEAKALVKDAKPEVSTEKKEEPTGSEVKVEPTDPPTGGNDEAKEKAEKEAKELEAKAAVSAEELLTKATKAKVIIFDNRTGYGYNGTNLGKTKAEAVKALQDATLAAEVTSKLPE